MTADERLSLIRVKLERAKQHLADLEVARDRFIATDPYTVGRKQNPEPGYENFDLWFMTSLDPVPVEISLIVGDAIHNLRSALDHLACQLVLVNGNSISDKTSFPIFKSTQIHEASFAGKVDGMGQPAKDKIRRTEPYKGGQGHSLWVLHELDIADKHHGLLTAMVRVGNMRMNMGGGLWLREFHTPGFSLPDFGDALELEKPFFNCERGIEHHTQFSFDVAIRQPGVFESKPAIWAVKFLIDTVDGLIMDFKSLLV